MSSAEAVWNWSVPGLTRWEQNDFMLTLFSLLHQAVWDILLQRGNLLFVIQGYSFSFQNSRILTWQGETNLFNSVITVISAQRHFCWEWQRTLLVLKGEEAPPPHFGWLKSPWHLLVFNTLCCSVDECWGFVSSKACLLSPSLPSELTNISPCTVSFFLLKALEDSRCLCPILMSSKHSE